MEHALHHVGRTFGGELHIGVGVDVIVGAKTLPHRSVFPQCLKSVVFGQANHLKLALGVPLQQWGIGALIVENHDIRVATRGERVDEFLQHRQAVVIVDNDGNIVRVADF